MFGGEPLMDDTLTRDFSRGIGGHVTLASEQTLLLPKDMVELRGFRKSEQEGKDVIETGRSRPTHEEEAQRAVKQQKVSHVPSRGAERTDI